MKYSLCKWKVAAYLVTGSSLIVLSLFASTLAASKNRPQAPKASVDSKPTPRSIDGHPDFNGYWSTPPSTTRGDDASQFQRSADGSVLFEFNVNENKETKICISDACQAANQPPYKPEYMAKVKEIAKTGFGGLKPGDPINQCRPEGLPRAFGAMEIVQTPKLVAILYEAAPYSTYRVIYTDGRSHPADLDESYFGDSIGHWEGDTLVVDVVGFNDDSWLNGDTYSGTKQYTNIHSNKEHVIERWTRTGDTLTYETTIEDPIMFTRPWVLAPRHIRLARPTDYLEYTTCTPTDVGIIRNQQAEGIQGTTYCPYRCADNTK